jgi:hypothetical protein
MCYRCGKKVKYDVYLLIMDEKELKRILATLTPEEIEM